MKLKSEIVVSNIKRTPFAQLAKGLGSYESYELGHKVAENIIKSSGVDKTKIDGTLLGEAFPSQANPAVVISGMLGIPVDRPALTLSNNCVSSLEAVAEACRRIELNEGKLFLTLGQESLTAFPIVIKGSRFNKKTGTLDKLLKFLPDQLPEGVKILDVLEEGLTGGDIEKGLGMHVTAELVAQNYNISRETSDKVAFQSFKRAFDATTAGKYKEFIVAMKDSDSGELLTEDEAVILRKGIVENPGRMQKALLLFDNPFWKFDEFKTKYATLLKHTHGPTVTIFNACPRSDGASGALISTKACAQEMGLKAQAKITGFRMKGVHPNFMGIGQAEASIALLDDLGLKMSDVDQVEIHEAFAATAIGALEEIKKRTGYDWEKKFDEGYINTFGGSISLGHPFGATGIRLISNAVMNFQEKPNVKRVLITACAAGGIAASLMLERI